MLKLPGAPAVLQPKADPMNLHEYQAKELLAKRGVPVPAGAVAYTASEAVAAATRLGGAVWAVKAQIHAGGRGKAGGIKLARSPDEVAAATRELLGNTLVTHQTGPEGRVIKRVYVETGVDITRELYLALSIDRATGRITLIGAGEGGIEIEQLAAHSPEKIVRLAIDPLVVTGAGELLALDAKVTIDDNALFRHPDIEALRDADEEDPIESEAGRHQLSYVKLDGNIGCMVNGAGLAMATMDIIKLYGAMPANFLDVGGGATRERVTVAFKLILSDPNVEAILVNIFGGIMRCDVLAEGIVAAAREINLHVPLVVRLEGTNVELGRRILSQSGLPLIAADNLDDAARKAVAAAQEAA